MPKKTVLTEAEKKEHKREAMKRWREKQKAKPKQQKPKKSLLPPLEEHDFATVGADDATVAALINQKFGYSKIIGTYHRGKRTIIAEHLKRTETDAAHYRLKVTTYLFFESEGALKNYAMKNGIPIQYT